MIMDAIMTALEWLGMGLAGIFILLVIWMIGAIVNAGRRDQYWD
jgi:hypothetical protein